MKAAAISIEDTTSSAMGTLTAWPIALAILASCFFFLWPTWSALHEYWLASNRYSHGHLILFLSAFLVYRQRDCLRIVKPDALPSGLVLVLVVLSGWLIGVLANFQAMHEVLLPLLVWVILLTVLGWTAARLLIFPVAYLYLAIPVWESVNFALQWATVVVNDGLLRLVQVPAYIEGNAVHLPAGSFSVDGGCSGLHYFLISVAISLLYGALYISSIKKRVLLLLFAVGLALITNWLRVFMVIIAGHLTDMQHYLVVHDHYYFGWVLYAVVMVPFFLFARLLDDDESSSRSLTYAASANVAGNAGSKSLVVVVLCTCFLAGASFLVHARASNDHAFEGLLLLPQDRSSWRRIDVEFPDWRPDFRGADVEGLAHYRGDSGVVSLYVNLYHGETQGKEVIGFGNQLEGTGRWVPQTSVYREVRAISGDALQVSETTLSSRNGARRLLYHWYFVNGRMTTRPYLTKLYYGLEAVTGIPDSGVTALSADCMETCDSARELIESWLAVYLADEPGKLFEIQD